MPVYKTKTEKTKDNKIWYFKCNYRDIYGNIKQKKSKKFSTKEEAIKEEAKFLILAGNTTTMSPTFDDIYNEYLIYKKKNCRETTIIRIKGYYKHIGKILGNIKIEKLTAKQYLLFQDEMNKLGLSTVYKNQLHSLVLSLIDYANLLYNVDSKVPKSIGKFKNPTEMKKEMLFWTYDEFNKFISIVDDNMYKVFFEILYFCGLRRGEIQALTWNDINFIKGTISINKTLTSKIKGQKYVIFPPKTQSSNRTIPIPKNALSGLKTLYKEYSVLDGFENECFVFGTFKPLADTSIERKKNKWCDIAEVKRIRIHDFRHSCASLLINNGANITIVSKYLGHSDISMTLNRYSHMYDSKLEEVINLIENINK